MTTPEEHQDGSSQPTNVPPGDPARGTSTPDPARVAAYGEAIWNTSRADEGTISVTGANIVACAVLVVADAELEALRAENERLREARTRFENAYVDEQGSRLTAEAKIAEFAEALARVRGENAALRASREHLVADIRAAEHGFHLAYSNFKQMLHRARAAEEKVRAVELAPAERMALTVAVAQVSRGESPSPNVAAVCVMALDRICAALADVPAEPREPEVDSCYCPDDHASWCPNLTPVVTPPADDEGGA